MWYYNVSKIYYNDSQYFYNVYIIKNLSQYYHIVIFFLVYHSVWCYHKSIKMLNFFSRETKFVILSLVYHRMRYNQWYITMWYIPVVYHNKWYHHYLIKFLWCYQEYIAMCDITTGVSQLYLILFQVYHNVVWYCSPLIWCCS